MEEKELIRDGFWSNIITAIKEDRILSAPWLVTKEENEKLDREWDEHVEKMNKREYSSSTARASFMSKEAYEAWDEPTTRQQSFFEFGFSGLERGRVTIKNIPRSEWEKLSLDEKRRKLI